ncbi:beta-ketoacyl synthase N-terminal-like domain-containing protein [Streptomyces sp. NBC_00059]|uniref:beta-ketoacyl synthase N-terminal-like domain-containing protein n=1 Tax=Streptomyces sp. NBC_00059 TaxID=2975635 RepID=UPI0022516D08|nr:beta-ketoacyl synthase N-terminal-like domain-containing protein [Streptomyces sp. NBC_00059]MCX5415781.1 hypothetical protein [Streptomyces sp. NBC_00059]
MTVTGAAVLGTGLRAPGQLLPGAAALGPRSEAADPAQVLGARGLRYKDRATCLALAAAQLALLDAGVERSAADLPDDCGVVVSSNHGNLDTVVDAAATIAEHGTDALSPMALPNASSNIAASSVAIRFRLGGPNMTLCNGPTSGLDALHWGRHLIVAGRARRVLVIGVESDTAALRSVTGADGTLFDGAAAVVLEDAADALRRGASGHTVVGPYARTASRDESVRALGALPPVTLWLEGRTDADEAHDLQQLCGEASGALGVLQCVAAAGRPRGAGATVATAGGAGHDAVAAMAFTPAERAA